MTLHKILPVSGPINTFYACLEPLLVPITGGRSWTPAQLNYLQALVSLHLPATTPHARTFNDIVSPLEDLGSDYCRFTLHADLTLRYLNDLIRCHHLQVNPTELIPIQNLNRFSTALRQHFHIIYSNFGNSIQDLINWQAADLASFLAGPRLLFLFDGRTYNHSQVKDLYSIYQKWINGISNGKGHIAAKTQCLQRVLFAGVLFRDDHIVFYTPQLYLDGDEKENLSPIGDALSSILRAHGLTPSRQFILKNWLRLQTPEAPSHSLSLYLKPEDADTRNDGNLPSLSFQNVREADAALILTQLSSAQPHSLQGFTAKIVLDLISLFPHEKMERYAATHHLDTVLGSSYGLMVGAMDQLGQRDSTAEDVARNYQIIVSQLAFWIRLVRPFSNSDLMTRCIDSLSLASAGYGHLTVQATSGGMDGLDRILHAMAAQLNPTHHAVRTRLGHGPNHPAVLLQDLMFSEIMPERPTTVLLLGTQYFELHDILDTKFSGPLQATKACTSSAFTDYVKDSQSSAIDLLITSFTPSITVHEDIDGPYADWDLRVVIDWLVEAGKISKHFTVAIDMTLTGFGHPYFERFRRHIVSHYPQVNVQLFYSGKYFTLGSDVAATGLLLGMNNGDHFGRFNDVIRDHSPLDEDGQLLTYFLDAAFKRIRFFQGKTNYIAAQIRNQLTEFEALSSFHGYPFYLAPIRSKNLPFLDIRTGPRQSMLLDILGDCARRHRLTIHGRPSFGFLHPTVGYVGNNQIRIYTGYLDRPERQKFIDVMAYLFAHRDQIILNPRYIPDDDVVGRAAFKRFF